MKAARTWTLIAILAGCPGIVGGRAAAAEGPASPAATPPVVPGKDRGAPEPTDWLARAMEARARGLVKQAIEFAGKAIESAPRDPRAYHLRAMLYERVQAYVAAEADLAKAIALVPEEAALFLQRGTLRLRMADFPGSVADYDRFAELRPGRLPELWQRGIALFYAGRWEDGRRQFALHRTVNPRDVENSVWHFLCVARQSGLDAARREWLAVEGDDRVPMREIAALFTGTGTAGAVEAAAGREPAGLARDRAEGYAHLYLALYDHAWERRDLATRHLAEAVKYAEALGIMGDIARVHADWLAAEIRGKR